MKSPKNNKTEWIDEFHLNVRYGMEGQILINEISPYQKIMVVESIRYGRGLLLDNCWMTAEGQEKHYHECLVHPALSGAENIDKILVIGGGDGGTARECLSYEEVKQLDLIEIDERVVALSKKYLPNIGGKAWLDNRLNLQIQDGIAWAENKPQNFYDIIIVDGSDPAGPAKGLFNQTFFKTCKKILKPGGIFAIQSESPEAFKEIHLEIVKNIRTVFNYADPIYSSVPMYPSGWWSWTFAAIDKPRFKNPIIDRAAPIEKNCEIWSMRWQSGAFEAIPAFIERELAR